MDCVWSASEILKWSYALVNWISSVQSLSRVQIFSTHGLQHARIPCPAPPPGDCSNSCPHQVHYAIQASHSRSSPSPLALNLSQHQCLFQWVGQRIRSFSFSNSPSNEYSGLISFSIDWFDLLTVQETLKSLLQHYSSKASVLGHSAFLTVQLSHPCTITGKTIALTIQTFFKVMSLLFNILSRFATAFLPRSNCLLISWLQSPSTVILEPKKIKSVTISLFSPICLPWSDGTIR